MVKLTLDFIARGTSGYTQKKRDETLPQYIRRLTHLYLENKNIDDVGDCLSMCKNLTVLYLYDNQLNRVPCLNSNSAITHLYLQNNNISLIENLNTLPQLQKLYLGGNTITVLEGLDKLKKLQELHVEHQRLPAGEQLLFDPRTLNALSGCLQVLNVSGNHLTGINDLSQLCHLNSLIAADNLLNDMKELAQLLATWTSLTRLDLTGNPICQQTKYKDRIIVLGSSLEWLDGKHITATARKFLVNWHANREENRKKFQENLMREETYPTSVHVHTGDLPPLRSAPLRQRSISSYVMPGLPRKQFDDILAKSHFPQKPRSGASRPSEESVEVFQMTRGGGRPPQQHWQ
ncbi:protein phosphatase 1 regulatory subunit 42-like isoform X2 [Physella acuta]|nr:protein phosphatase 1 regulatory subunit 42-like isoform X2 [Physella acuta]XP_059177591.1 protein phosphatase 1 regulatory subunit 42-like isoform X2 [Physella acuta]XP_059177592.1 protein phosphatase 1 regulatory subunit 42-like isoform X2 [Physella acuta]XP_059177593.1 protein phosphatase 1 regulatory subunit 42-like isoform X2 [Physella acuta]XP_059177594.1 protein phosphatase 1 regulatory subunit 42-like isoform X2 [Physella acuta]XP_059177595.1 protein phosphatase 1 regulatory subunit